jgi:hypothetical protein
VAGLEVGHSLAYNVEVKNGWSCTSGPLICLHGVESDNLTYADVQQEWCITRIAGS